MPAPTVRCPACQAVLVLKNPPAAGVSLLCPRCKARVPAPQDEADPAAPYAVAPEEQGVVAGKELEGVVATRRPRPGDSGVRERPPQRKKRRRPPKQKPMSAGLAHMIGWPVCLAGVGFLYLIQYLIFGAHGLPQFRPDEPAFQIFLLIVFVILGPIGVFQGINAVVNKEMTLGHRIGWVAWETQHSGTAAVVLGVLHYLLGVFLLGVGIYGLRFHPWGW